MRTLIVVALVAGTACGRMQASASYPTPAAATPSLEPPALVTPSPPRRTRYYAAKIIALDLLVLATVYPVLTRAYDGEDAPGADALAAGYTAAYLFGGPLIHGLEGNKQQSGNSFLRRVGYPALGGLAGWLIGDEMLGDDCHDECWVFPVLGAVAGAALGGVVAAIHDWTKAHIDF